MKIIIALAVVLSGALITSASAQTHYELCSAIHGAHIRTTDSEDVGTIDDLLIDPREGRIVTIITSVNDRLIPVPWTAVSAGEDLRVITVNTTRERLVTAPTIERSQITTFTPEVYQRSESFFRETAAPGSATSTNVTTQQMGNPGTATTRDQNVGTSETRARQSASPSTSERSSMQAGSSPAASAAASPSSRKRQRATAGSSPSASAATSPTAGASTSPNAHRGKHGANGEPAMSPSSSDHTLRGGTDRATEGTAAASPSSGASERKHKHGESSTGESGGTGSAAPEHNAHSSTHGATEHGDHTTGGTDAGGSTGGSSTKATSEKTPE